MTFSSVAVSPQSFKTFVSPVRFSVDYYQGKLLYAQGWAITACTTDQMTQGYLAAEQEEIQREIRRGGNR